jgi:hypothetical protein
LLGELEHLKIKTRLIDEKFAKALFFLCSSGLFLFLFAERVFSIQEDAILASRADAASCNDDYWRV